MNKKHTNPIRLCEVTVGYDEVTKKLVTKRLTWEEFRKMAKERLK